MYNQCNILVVKNVLVLYIHVAPFKMHYSGRFELAQNRNKQLEYYIKAMYLAKPTRLVHDVCIVYCLPECYP